MSRALGQSVEIMLIVDSKVFDTITDIKNFEVAHKLETLQEGYLGLKTDLYDEVYKGVRGKMEVHFHDAEIFRLMRSVVDRAKRRVPGVKINIKQTISFDSGERKVVVIPDVSFGEMPMNVPGRSEYLNVSLDFSASNYNEVTA